MAESSARRHRYNYRGNSDAEDVNWDFIASPLDDNNDKALIDVKVVEKYKPKIHRRRVGAANRKGKFYPGNLCQEDLC